MEMEEEEPSVVGTDVLEVPVVAVQAVSRSTAPIDA